MDDADQTDENDTSDESEEDTNAGETFARLKDLWEEHLESEWADARKEIQIRFIDKVLGYPSRVA
jgi:hypothetical protein